jgi:hypothetical protein
MTSDQPQSDGQRVVSLIESRGPQPMPSYVKSAG